ncbi:MAG: hypothetical protein CVU71_14415 [Deltaproteobacteria bacterium HGW-Deltaproteobacteria-6]|nr:MAG: hypothetical protein CVU71_14415 [Deltaproteobacteria bacterium HGW-Deltaproteobacteria-6]
MKIKHLYPIAFVICAIIGAIVGKTTGYGALRGMTDGIIIAALPLFLIILIYPVLTAWRPVLPVCRCGKSRARNYLYIGPADAAQTDGSVRFKCPTCGRIYEKDHNRFNELMPDGKMVPYMSHSKWGRWRQTPASQPSPGDAAS